MIFEKLEEPHAEVRRATVWPPLVYVFQVGYPRSRTPLLPDSFINRENRFYAVTGYVVQLVEHRYSGQIIPNT